MGSVSKNDVKNQNTFPEQMFNTLNFLADQSI